MSAQTLVASAARTESGNSGALTPFRSTLGVKALILQLTVSAAATESGDLLDVYVQHSPDDGTTWDDFIHFTQVLGNGGAKKFIATWMRDVTPESELKAPADASLAAGVLQGPISPMLRVKWVLVDASTDNASFTFSVTAQPIFDAR
jgi:hypothetical protein